MPRIRTIKPEFWTDEKIVQLPFEARLLFIGLWNFSDDEGWLSEEAERIRLQVFPSDSAIDIPGLLDLLFVAGFVDRFIADDGRPLLCIRHFQDHQKISHATPSKLADVTYRKATIATAVRCDLAKKYGCPPGGEVWAQCYYCGEPGQIRWWPRYSDGKPSRWVTFGALEMDHFDAELEGGSSNLENMVLACRPCNRAKKDKPPFEFLHERHPQFQEIRESLSSLHESGHDFAPEGKERKGKERKEGKEVAKPRIDENPEIPDWRAALENQRNQS